MLTALNSYGIAAWALADDIVIATRGEYHLSLAVKTLRQHSKNLDLEINQEKSGLMCVRIDDRQPALQKATIGYGFPIVRKYKYLGIVLDDKGKHHISDLAKRNQLDQLKKKSWILHKGSISGKAKVQLWKSLFLSKWTYGMEAFISDTDTVYQSYRNLYYKSVNLLTKISQKVQKDILLNQAIGLSFKCHVSNIIAEKLRRLDIEQEPRCNQCQ